MNSRQGAVTGFLLMTVVVAVGAVFSLPEPHVNIVGKWQATSVPGWKQNHSYDLFADGHFVEKAHVLEQMNDGEKWTNQVSEGNYEVSSDSQLTLSTVRFVCDGELQEGWSQASGIRLHVHDHEITADFQPQEH